ncbi:anti-sigma factor family protein [Natranaerobius thermophilus]|uniref:Anti-sigma-W factor RsiW n=1 Tax=Natranaerobius thermophilus (strain ATCC BAA-1301 / DSM 18059 / JW/NM-WN-LF) TaxID=457570 RepID=B2A647_NATTJ|nr:zf-HC2 domain-containing protein [Natranaerobius thermophilus]ACB85464.1 putative transmembrane anti-sigma factor [Natranaerobius thermophilus JW/NM-WN-LF]
MNCSWIIERLSSYLDDQLCPLDVKKVEKHLKNCETCSAELNKLKNTSTLVSSLERVSPPANFVESVCEQATGVEQVQQENKQHFIFDNLLSLKNVAAVLLGVLLLGNGMIFAFYEGDEMAESEHEINLSESEQEKFIEKMAGVLDRDYYHPDAGEADVRMASSVGEIDISKYEETGEDADETNSTPFMIFNGAFLPIAASMVIIFKNRERGE